MVMTRLIFARRSSPREHIGLLRLVKRGNGGSQELGPGVEGLEGFVEGVDVEAGRDRYPEGPEVPTDE
jgi:hypothetical protein